MKHTSPWSDDFFVVIWEAFLIAACWLFTTAEEYMRFIWAFIRHENLGSSLVVYCRLKSIKTSVRPSLKGISYLFEIAQVGAEWGVIFDTMLAEEDVVIPIAEIQQLLFGYMLICSSICTCLWTMMGKNVVAHKFYFDHMLMLPEYAFGLNGPSFWAQFLLCIHLTLATIANGIFTQCYSGLLMLTEHVNWITDAILQYWNDYTHAVLACVALALFSMYKLETIIVSNILSFAATFITCMS